MEGCDAVFHVAAHVVPWGKYSDFHLANVVGTQVPRSLPAVSWPLKSAQLTGCLLFIVCLRTCCALLAAPA